MADLIQATFVGPDGQEHQVNGLREFCREHDLDHGNTYQVYIGARRHHKGFTCPEAGYTRTYTRST